MNVHTPPGLAIVLCLILPVSGIVGCQVVKGLLQDPALTSDIASLGDVVLDCTPVGSEPHDVAECLDTALDAAGAISDRHDIAMGASSCASVLREGGAAHLELARLDAKIAEALEPGGSSTGG